MRSKYAPRSWSLGEKLEHGSVSEPVTGCRLWCLSCNKKGYGRLRWDHKIQQAHRMSWEAHFGPVPEGLHVLHKCDVPACINPDHLWLGTNADNNADKITKGRQRPCRGARNGSAKLREVDIIAIRSDQRAHTSIARDYGVTGVHVGHIKAGRVWSHVGGI